MSESNQRIDAAQLPQGWKLIKLGEITKNVSVKNADNRIQHVVSVTKYRGIVDSLEFFKKQVFSKELSTYKVIKKGQFAYATIHLDEGSIGFLAEHGEAILSPMYTVFEPKRSKVELGYLFTVLKSDELLNVYNHIGSGSINRRKSIPYSTFAQIEIALPPLHEQQKIAEILSTLDEKMAIIDEQLAQTQKLKNGLTGHLVTKGIGHTLFQDSPLGKIPESWEIARGEEISSLITKGASPGWQGFDYVEEGLLFVTSENVRGGHLDLSNPKFLPLAFNKKVAKSQLKNGDILINIVGASIGRACLYESSYQVANVNQAVCVLRSNDKVLSNYLIHFLQAPDTIKRLLGTQAGSARQNLSLSDIRGFIMALPPLPEQRQIAEILTTVDDKIGVLQDKKAQYHTLKKGLMQQLLTGQRRVRVAEQVPALA